jgi:dihydropyrimidinase
MCLFATTSRNSRGYSSHVARNCQWHIHDIFFRSCSYEVSDPKVASAEINTDLSRFHVEGSGKRLGLIDGKPIFTKIPNGLPGLETRIPLLFKGVSEGKITIQDFVRVGSTNPAKLYGLTKKGSIIPGNDADICIWYLDGKMAPMTLSNSMLHHDIDYTPYEGFEFSNWPRLTLLRGKVVWDKDNGGFLGKMGDGTYIKRTASTLAGPRNVFVNEWVPPS